MTSPAVPATPKPEAKKRAPARAYVVLERRIDDGWQDVAKIDASSADQAIIRHVGQRDGQPLVDMVAVPAKYWKVRKPKIETKSTIKLG